MPDHVHATAQALTPIPFTRGVPPTEAIPWQRLADHTTAVLEDQGDAVFQYAKLGRYLGDPSLRAQLGKFHDAASDRIFVGNGSLQVVDLVAQLLLAGDNKRVFVEAPTYDRSIQILARHGAEITPLPLQADGIDLAVLESHLASGPPAAVYLIPDFQNPSGVTLSEEKRRALVELAEHHGFILIEDIPYRELRYHGRSPATLNSMAAPGRVITIGSLSKILSPGLRIGYAIADPATAISLAALAEATYLSPPPLCQAVAARCFADGLVDANIELNRELFRPRLDAALGILNELFGDALMAEPAGGYFVGLAIAGVLDEGALSLRADAASLSLTAGSAFYRQGVSGPDGATFVRLPFHALEPEVFSEGVRRLREIVR